MSRHNSTSRYPEKPSDWHKVALKYQRSVDAEEAKARALILKEIAAKKTEKQQPEPKLRRKGAQQ